jgi:hypothetical protein
MYLLTSRKDFEYYFMNIKKIKNYIKTYIMYFNLNYPFPNVNPFFFNRNSKKYWLLKIKAMYFVKEGIVDENWYKLI